MVPFPTAARTLSSCVEAQPDLLPAAWREDDSRCLEVDVGCHKGRFLIEMARKFPLSNFLGVERQQRRAQKAQEKISRLGLENAAVVHGDGLEALRRLPEACADYVHVLFPDPWPKRRHQARRMVQTQFLREISRVLKGSGILRLLTDDSDYLRAIETHAAGLLSLRQELDNQREYPPTEFQIKCRADSRPFYSVLLRPFS
jgi:tRNA (guanine-N7-)-methyltransferase